MAWDDKATKVWVDGEFVEWKDANISVLSHVVHYGTSVFEGIRAYSNEKGVAVFRLEEHVQRLFDSAKIYKMDIPFTQEEIAEAIIETVRVNDLDGCYIRPIVFRGYGELGVNPLGCPVNVAIAAWEWGSYLGEEVPAVLPDRGADVGRSPVGIGKNENFHKDLPCHRIRIAKRPFVHIVKIKGVFKMKLDRKTITMLSGMPNDRLWSTLKLFASGMGMELSERKRHRIDYDALRYTLSRITDEDICRVNEISETYKEYSRGGMRW